MTTNNTTVLDASRLHHIKDWAVPIRCQTPQFATIGPLRLRVEAHKVPVGAGFLFFEKKSNLFHFGVKVSQTSMLVYASYAPGSDTLVYRRTKKGGLDQNVFVLEFKKRAGVWPLAIDLSSALLVRPTTEALDNSIGTVTDTSSSPAVETAAVDNEAKKTAKPVKAAKKPKK